MSDASVMNGIMHSLSITGSNANVDVIFDGSTFGATGQKLPAMANYFFLTGYAFATTDGSGGTPTGSLRIQQVTPAGTATTYHSITANPPYQTFPTPIRFAKVNNTAAAGNILRNVLSVNGTITLYGYWE